LPAVLPLKPQDVDSPQKRAQFTVCVVGCGVEGSFYVLAFADAGFKVFCTDADQSVVKRLSKGNLQLKDRQQETKLKTFLRKEQVVATSDLSAAVSASDIIFLTVSPRVDEKRIVQTSEVGAACKQVGAALHRGSLVIYSGAAGIGFTEGTIKETIENTSGLESGEGFGLAYQPQLATNTPTGLGEQEVIVAANDKYSQNAAYAVFGCVAKTVVKASNVRLAEAAALFLAAKRDADLALGNELAVLCENAELDYIEALNLLGNKNIEPNVATSANAKETFLLLENAESLNVKLKIPALARQINEEMVKRAVNLIQETTRVGGGTLRRARVALLGDSESPDGELLSQLLETKGAKVSRYNPNSSGNKSENNNSEPTIKKTLNEAVEGANCVVLFSAQETLRQLNLKKLHALMKSPASLVDLAGFMDSQKVEAEGFIYRGLGRGVHKK
jgi:nucleotide sugar dehydrogenase